MAKHNVYLKYKERHHGGDICEGEEDSDWPSHEDGYIDLTWGRATIGVPPRDSTHYDVETVELDKPAMQVECLYAVVVRYTDGDTFGCCHGYHKVISVHDSMEAAQKALAAFHCGELPEDVYPSWTGYFASLDEVGIVSFDVEESRE